MSQSREDCPYCVRPRGVHGAPCPRSPESRRRLDASLQRPARVVWPALGPVHASVPRRARNRAGRLMAKVLGMRRVDTWNPGVPMVKPGKHWTAGGLPRGRLKLLDGTFADKGALARRFYMDFIGPIRGEV